MASATRWALAIAFFAGLAGGDGTAFVALAALVQATMWPRAPWNAALLAVAGWAAGTGVTVLLNTLTGVQEVAPPSELGAGPMVLAAYASAAAGAALAWVSSRLTRQGQS